MTDTTRSSPDTAEMLTARALVERHIAVFGYVPNPDKMKEAIADALCRCAAQRPFYGAECPSYPDCNGGCGLGCTKEIERPNGAAQTVIQPATNAPPKINYFRPAQSSIDRDELVNEIAARSPGVPKATIRNLLEADDAVPPSPVAGEVTEDQLARLMDASWPDGHRAMARKILERFTLSPVPSTDRQPSPLKEATKAQHFDTPKGEPARFVRNGVLETCQCRDCAAMSPAQGDTP